MSDTPTARDTAALVDLMWLVMRRIWDHAEERLASYSLSLKHNWTLHALDEPMSMSAPAASSSAGRIRPTGGSRAWRSRPRAGGSARSSRTSYGSTCRSSMRSRPMSGASSGGYSQGPATRHREAEWSEPRAVRDELSSTPRSWLPCMRPTSGEGSPEFRTLTRVTRTFRP